MKRLLLLIPVIVIVGCGLFGGEDFFPLAVDNEWLYEGHEYSGDSSNFVMNSKITGEDQINGNDVFVFVDNTTYYQFFPMADTFEESETSYVREDKDTIWYYFSKTDSMPMIVALLPFELGKTWDMIYGTDTTTFTMTAQEDVTVPADTYKDCWKIEMKSGGTVLRNMWFADGVGQIKVTGEGYLAELKEPPTIK
jgi:hypothetical protein